MTLLYSLALSLSLTLIFELAAAEVWGIADRRDVITLVCVNIITNPVVVTISYILRRTLSCSVFVWQLPLEAAVVTVEWLLYRKYGKSITRPFMFSLSANAFSYGMGLLLPMIF